MVRLIEYFALVALCTRSTCASPVFNDGSIREPGTGPRPMHPRVPSIGVPYPCDGKNYTNIELAGYGAVPGSSRDKFGDTLSMGSAIAITDWKSEDQGKTYTATVWALPDRGW